MRVGLRTSAVEGRPLGAGRWGRALRSGVERVPGAWKWREYQGWRGPENLGGKARLGWEVLDGEDRILGGGARDGRVGALDLRGTCRRFGK